MNFEKVVVIDKARSVYTLDGIKVIFDTIKGFGDALELELKSADDSEVAEKKIFALAAKIGLKKADCEEKSVTYLVLKSWLTGRNAPSQYTPDNAVNYFPFFQKG